MSKKYPVLPYEMRVEIWDLIDRPEGISNDELVERFLQHAPQGVSEEQFRDCITGIRGRHTLGQRPSKKR